VQAARSRRARAASSLILTRSSPRLTQQEEIDQQLRADGMRGKNVFEESWNTGGMRHCTAPAADQQRVKDVLAEIQKRCAQDVLELYRITATWTSSRRMALFLPWPSRSCGGPPQPKRGHRVRDVPWLLPLPPSDSRFSHVQRSTRYEIDDWRTALSASSRFTSRSAES